jgi:hypothetical protein
MNFKLRFQKKEIADWAKRNQHDLSALTAIGNKAKKRGYLLKDEFLDICEVKSVRTKPLCAGNNEDFVQEVSKVAFGSKHERVKIEALLMLEGVSWPTASYILHFCDEQEYPILDFRALWSLSIAKPPPYDFVFWEAYTAFCRGLVNPRQGIAMRTLDAALWQYSVEKQPR